MNFLISSDFSSSYEEDSDDINIPIAPKPKEIPQNLTIDAIFQSRKTEIKLNSLKKEETKEEIKFKDNPEINSIKLDLGEIVEKDLPIINESIFNQVKIAFPTSVFQKLKTNSEINQQFSIISKELILSFGFDITFLDITENLIYSLLHSLLITNDDEYGQFLIKILKKIPKLDFSIILHFFKKIIESSNQSLIIYPALLINGIYYHVNQDIRDDIFLLFISIVICSDITNHRNFYLIIDNFNYFKPNLSIIPVILPVILGSEIQGIGNIVTYMKITPETAGFFVTLYISLVNTLFQMEIPPPKTAKEILDILVMIVPKLKALIDTGQEDLLLRASAILTLIEQIVVAAKLQFLISHEQAEGLCRALKFNNNCENGTYLFLLKEQLQFTLTQIEYITEATINPHANDDPFFKK